MGEVSDEKFWFNKIIEHWKAFVIMVIIGIYFIISMITVFFRYMQLSWIGGFGGWTFDQFSVGTLFLAIIQICLWELLLTLIPAGAAFGIFMYLWWKQLPEDEKSELKKREEKQKSHKARNYGGGGGGMSFIMNIATMIIIYTDGFWLTPFGSVPGGYSYFVYAAFTGFLWIFFIFILPACILGLAYLIKKYK